MRGKRASGRSCKESQVGENLAAQLDWPEHSRVRKHWAEISDNERMELLSVSLTALRQAACNSHICVPCDQTTTACLEEALARLGGAPTWQRWQWNPQAPVFTSASAFRSYLRKEQIPAHLQRLLTQDTSTITVRKYQQALQTRMVNLLQEIAKHRETQQTEKLAYPCRTFRKSDVICMIMEAVVKEHPHVYHAFVAPLIHVVQSLLPGHRSKIQFKGVLEDFGLLIQEVDQLKQERLDMVTSWFERQITDLTHLATGQDGADDSALPTFAITQHGSRLSVSPEWFKVLQGSSSDMSGDQSGLTGSADAILNWLNSISMSTLPKQSLPGQNAKQAHQLLIRTLQSLLGWKADAIRIKELREALLDQHQRSMGWLKSHNVSVHPDKHGPKMQLPSKAIEYMLCHEKGFSTANAIHVSCLVYQQQRHLFYLGTQIEQALALRRHLLQHQKLIDDQIQMGAHHEPDASPAVKNQAVQLKQEQMQEGARLGNAVHTLDEQIKDTYQQLNVTTEALDEQDAAHEQADAWANQITQEVAAHTEALQRVRQAELVHTAQPNMQSASRVTTERQRLRHLRRKFEQDIWPKIATPEQIAALLKVMQEEQQHMERLVQEGCAVLPLIEGQVVDAACTDPGALLMPHLILPMLRQQIDSKLDQRDSSTTSASCGMHPDNNRSVQQLESRYTDLVQVSPRVRHSMWGPTVCTALQLKCMMQKLQTEKTGQPPAYAAYGDDILLQHMCTRSDKALLDNPLVDTFVGDMQKDCAWFALLLCSYT